MMITGTEITVTGEVRGIDLWIGGSEAVAQTEGDQIAATDRIMTGGERHLATAAMSGAGKGTCGVLGGITEALTQRISTYQQIK